MYARQVDQRSAIFQKALEVGEAYQLRTQVQYQITLVRHFAYSLGQFFIYTCVYIMHACS